MTPEELGRERVKVTYEYELVIWAENDARRNDLVFNAVALGGLSKNRVHVLTGIARTTIDRIIAGTQC